MSAPPISRQALLQASGHTPDRRRDGVEKALIPEEKGLDARALVVAGKPRPASPERARARGGEGAAEEREAEQPAQA